MITYRAGAFDDDGQFRAEPPACGTLAPSLHLLGIAYTLRQDESNNCDLLVPPDHPDYIPYPKISVGYYVATPQRGMRRMPPVSRSGRSGRSSGRCPAWTTRRTFGRIGTWSCG